MKQHMSSQQADAILATLSDQIQAELQQQLAAAGITAADHGLVITTERKEGVAFCRISVRTEQPAWSLSDIVMDRWFWSRDWRRPDQPADGVIIQANGLKRRGTWLLNTTKQAAPDVVAKAVQAAVRGLVEAIQARHDRHRGELAAQAELEGQADILRAWLRNTGQKTLASLVPAKVHEGMGLFPAGQSGVMLTPGRHGHTVRLDGLTAEQTAAVLALVAAWGKR